MSERLNWGCDGLRAGIERRDARLARDSCPQKLVPLMSFDLGFTVHYVNFTQTQGKG